MGHAGRVHRTRDGGGADVAGRADELRRAPHSADVVVVVQAIDTAFHIEGVCVALLIRVQVVVVYKPRIDNTLLHLILFRAHRRSQPPNRRNHDTDPNCQPTSCSHGLLLSDVIVPVFPAPCAMMLPRGLANNQHTESR